MSSNYRRNKAAIDQYRRELRTMLDDISSIDIKVLNRAVNEGMAHAKQNTKVISGHLRRSWRSAPAVKRTDGSVTKKLVNTADYAAFYNYGHRIVNRAGETVGFVRGKFVLEKAVSFIDKQIAKEFQKEIERVRREHGSNR